MATPCCLPADACLRSGVATQWIRIPLVFNNEGPELFTTCSSVWSRLLSPCSCPAHFSGNLRGSWEWSEQRSALTKTFRVHLKLVWKKNLKLLNGNYESLVNLRSVSLSFFFCFFFTADLWGIKARLDFRYARSTGRKCFCIVNFDWSFYIVQRSLCTPATPRLPNAGCGLRLVPKIEHCRSLFGSLLCQTFSGIS